MDYFVILTIFYDFYKKEADVRNMPGTRLVSRKMFLSRNFNGTLSCRNPEYLQAPATDYSDNCVGATFSAGMPSSAFACGRRSMLCSESI